MFLIKAVFICLFLGCRLVFGELRDWLKKDVHRALSNQSKGIVFQPIRRKNEITTIPPLPRDTRHVQFLIG